MDYLIARTRPYLANALVDERAFATMRSVAAQVPAVSGAIIECRLAADRSDVDLSVRALVADGGRDAFAWTSDLRPPDALLGVPAWQRIRAFCRAWSDERSPLSRHVETVWLEFDSRTLDEARPVPSVFFSTPHVDGRDPDWIPDVAVSLLRGAPLSGGARRRIRRFVDALPDDGTLDYVGVMLSRDADATRCCASLPVSRVLEYLGDIGWTHATAGIERVLDDVVGDVAHRVTLHVDVGETFLPTLGVEVKPDPDDRWPEFLECLVRGDLCTREKAEGVARWSGHDAALGNGTLAEQVSLRPPTGREAFESALMVRTVNHSKIECHPERAPMAKAYLYAGFVWAGMSLQAV